MASHQISLNPGIWAALCNSRGCSLSLFFFSPPRNVVLKFLKYLVCLVALIDFMASPGYGLAGNARYYGRV